MDRDVPSVPITTLAGVASLTDLLPEMPLPTPLPQTLSNKSLLFHPRVAEEAQNLLRARDDTLVPQLVHSLSQTSADHIDVKDNFICTETSVVQQKDIPELLQAMIAKNPNVFRGNMELNNIPAIEKEVEPPLPVLELKTPKKHVDTNEVKLNCTPILDVVPPPLENLFKDDIFNERINSDNTTNKIDNINDNALNADGIPNELQPIVSCNDNEMEAIETTESNAELDFKKQHFNSVKVLEELLSVEEVVAAVKVKQDHVKHQQLRCEQDQLPQQLKQQQVVQEEDGMDKSIHVLQPIVRLQRISSEDQILIQKSVSSFIENKPKLAKELGIVNNSTKDARVSRSYKEQSNSDEEEEEDFTKKKRKNKKNYIADEEDDYVPDTFSALVGKKRRHDVEKIDTPVIKPKLRKVEKKFGPVMQKLSIEELMETNTYGRFNKNVEHVLKFYSEIDVSEIGEDGLVPDEHLLNRHVVQELCTEAAKLKISSAMEMIPSDKLVKLLNALEITIRGADRVTPITDEDNESMRQIWIETAMERVMGAADASLTCMHILTSRNMPKRVYIEDVIDRIVLYIKYQMYNTIFPSYDVTYRLDNKKKDGRRKKSAHVLEKSIQTLYNKISELVTLLSDLLDIQILTDTSVLHASSMGVSPFFTENVSELQLSCLKLVTTIFTKYEKHRRLLLDDILASIARLPSTKRSLRSYKLNSDENIQMLTALVLQLIQCVVVLPENLCSSKKERDKDRDKDPNADNLKNVDKDVLICNKSREALSTAATFLSAFLNKVGNKTEEIDYRPLFENFVQDLLATVNKPEWPATELVLDLLGKLLVSNFSNKGTDMSLRVASLDYLGVVAARLRRDSVFSRCKLNTIDQMIKEIKSEEMKENDEEINKQKLEVKNDEERIQFLQRVLLDFLAVNAQNDEAYRFARHFYIVQWYKECNTEKSSISNNEKDGKHNSKDNHRNRKSINDDSDSESDEAIENHKGEDQQNSEKIKDLDERKKFLISKIRPFKETVSAGNMVKVFETYIDYNSAELIAQYLASKRHFSQCFDRYLKAILIVLKESSIAIRTKAMKCLTMIVEADPSVLGRHDMQMGVNLSFLDHSTSVREAAVDLVGKFVLNRPELINKYYEMLSARILDTGVSVRKRVIKILKDICIECPEFPKIPEICVKMIRRVNDEEGIRKLVMEVFQNMWFTPSPKDTGLLRKVMNITDVVASCKDIGFEWFEQLLLSLFKPKEDKEDSTKINTEPPKALLLACRQIVDCLIENVLKFEETSDNGGTSDRLIACLTTLFLFAKIRPQLLVEHAITLQPYLSLKCETSADSLIIMRVSKMLELVVPLMEHPSDSFLAQLEEDNMKLILKHDRHIVASCISCLGSIINRVTRNFKLIRDCFTRYYSYLERFQNWLQNSEEHQLSLREVKCRQYFRRSLFIVGLILRYFDFKNVEVTGEKLLDIKDKIYSMFIYFLQQDDDDIQGNTLKAMGSICIRHYEFMLEDELKCFYHRMLTSDEVPLKMKSEVLYNIESYLTEEESRMIQQDLEWSKRSKEENLKEMGDVSSGMASTIIQLYLKEILQSYLHPDVQVRSPALKVIQLVLQQGLVHPVQIVPYLICMSTDQEVFISHTADKQLQEIEKKYPGFIHAKSSLGISLSYKLQRILQEVSIVRGFKIKEQGEYPSALNGYLYSLLRSSRQQRRALVLNILKQFDDQARASLSYMLYLADNLAYFPYQVQDEPLFIVHHIDVMISVSGTNLLQTFREGLLITDAQKMANESSGKSGEQISALDEDDDDEDTLAERVPEDVSQLQACITAAQGCLLLLVLKQHIKDTYGLSDSKIQQYSPSEPAKVYEKTANRKSNTHFNPKATVNRIKQGMPPDFLDFDGRKELIKQYLDFKQLMLQLDPDDLDDDENQKNASTTNASLTMNSSSTNATGPAPSSTSILTEADQVVLTNYKDNPPPKVPKLVISNRRLDSDTKQNARKRTTEKSKKHRHKKKRRKFVSSSGDESENDFSDPDFMA